MSVVLPQTMLVTSVVEVLSGSILVFAGLSVSPMGEVSVRRPDEAGDVLYRFTSVRLVTVNRTAQAEQC